ncbi:MAG: hypothetical protein LLF94_12355 [Chlamydiales bacterium]|nr:hypothetical protein [Chlamydiales bacterium]
MNKFHAIVATLALSFASLLPLQASHCNKCCMTGVFWMSHHDMWPEGFSPDSEICGISFHEILSTPTNGHPWHVLAHQWVTAQLNVANGATSHELGSALEDAEHLLKKEDFSKKPDHIHTYITLAGILADHNNGVLSGSKHCPDDIILVCPPCPACCCPKCPEIPECPACPQCPQCPELTCGTVECNCPEQAVCICPEAPDCVCNCDQHNDCPASPSSSSSSSSCSHKHRHRHHHHHRNAAAIQNKVAAVPVVAKKTSPARRATDPKRTTAVKKRSRTHARRTTTHARKATPRKKSRRRTTVPQRNTRLERLGRQ